MIKRFSIYENKIYEESILPTWVDEKIIKPATNVVYALNTDKSGKPILNIIGNQDNEMDESLKKLYNTPIANIPISAYAQLMDIMDEERVKLITLPAPLKTDSVMLELAAQYYLTNIAKIIDAINNKSDISFGSSGVSEETTNILNKNPITVGTIIRNTLVDWYLSKEPLNKLLESLNTAVLEVKEEDTHVTETYTIIYESKGEGLGVAAKSGINIIKNLFFKGGEEAGAVLKASDDVAKLASTSKLNFTKANSVDDGLKSIDNAADDIVNNYNKAHPDVQNAVKQKLTVVEQEAKAMSLPDKSKLKPITDPVTSPTHIESGRPKIPEPTLPLDTPKNDKVKGWFQKFLENRAKNKANNTTPNIPKPWSIRSGLTKIFKGIGKLFTAGGFLLKLPFKAWSIVKWGGIFYGVYWVAKRFEKLDGESAREPLRELLTVFEQDLAHRKHEPFLTFHDMGEKFKAAIAKEDVRESIKSWCTSLYDCKIMSSSDYQKCVTQIDSDAFNNYIEANSTVSKNFVNAMEAEWESHLDLPSPGLLTMGLASAYSSVLSKFEEEFYKGKVPLTADSKNLDRPVGITDRTDSAGNKRNTLQIGDEGEDVKLLQSSLKKLGVYTGEINGKYDEEMAKIITLLQTNAQPTNTEIEVNGIADLAIINYLSKQISLLSGVIKNSIGITVSPEEIQKRQQAQGYIQQMQAALANR
jgi:hypothetical protein